MSDEMKEMMGQIYAIPCINDCPACKKKYGTQWCPKHYCDEYKRATLAAKANEHKIREVIESMADSR